MASEAKPFVTPEEYLRLDREAEIRSEYYAGQMYAMSGGTDLHAQISANVTGELRSLFRATSCTTFNSDLRIHIPATGLYTYADALVVCGERELLDNRKDTLLNPALIVEVLSPSTENYDRGGKFVSYRSIPSLREYLVVSQDRVLVEQWLLTEGHWTLTEYRNRDEYVELFDPQAGRLPVSEIYYGVSFPSGGA